MYDIYDCNEDDSSRFLLGKSGRRTLFIIGLNPSTATREKSDPTVAKAEKVARNNGFDGVIICNLYPLRSTNPRELPPECDPQLFAANIEKIIARANREAQPTCWAAWGGGITLRPYLAEAFAELEQALRRMNVRWLHYGALRKDGHPRHPCHLSYAWAFHEFDMAGYKRKFNEMHLNSGNCR